MTTRLVLKEARSDGICFYYSLLAATGMITPEEAMNPSQNTKNLCIQVRQAMLIYIRSITEKLLSEPKSWMNFTYDDKSLLERVTTRLEHVIQPSDSGLAKKYWAGLEEAQIVASAFRMEVFLESPPNPLYVMTPGSIHEANLRTAQHFPIPCINDSSSHIVGLQYNDGERHYRPYVWDEPKYQTQIRDHFSQQLTMWLEQLSKPPAHKVTFQLFPSVAPSVTPPSAEPLSPFAKFFEPPRPASAFASPPSRFDTPAAAQPVAPVAMELVPPFGSPAVQLSPFATAAPPVASLSAQGAALPSFVGLPDEAARGSRSRTNPSSRARLEVKFCKAATKASAAYRNATQGYKTWDPSRQAEFKRWRKWTLSLLKAAHGGLRRHLQLFCTERAPIPESRHDARALLKAIKDIARGLGV